MTVRLRGARAIDMTEDTWAAINGLLDDALELPALERAAWLERLGPEHDALRPRLRRLLVCAEHHGDTSFLNTIPKVDHAADSSLDGEVARPPLDVVGPYRIERKLGEGGMGSVWLAHRTDGMLNRPVALKLARGAWRGSGLAERMRREREILATLEHPHIARLYDAGVTGDGQPYLALEYVAGRPIDAYVRDECPDVRSRLRLFLQVARAVAHAHAKLIVHRDIKPSNVLVTDAGEVRLLDFGIAKLLEDGRLEDGTVTEASGLPLTPDYASPEQLAGEPLSIASDVYSLGVLLYEVLAGTRPYTLGPGSRGTRRLAGPPEVSDRPSARTADGARRRALRGDLDTIVLKAIKRRPEERYTTVNAFLEDVERQLEGRPVLARPDCALYRLSKFVARHRAAVTGCAAACAAVLSGAGVAIWQAHAASAERAYAGEVRDLLATIFVEASPYNGGTQSLAASDWLKHVRALVARLDRPELRVELLNSVGSSLLTLQDTSAAEAVLTQAIQEGTEHLGAAHPQTLRARVLFTPVYRYQGRTRDMRAELQRLLPVLRARADELAEPLVVALKNQAHLEVDDGRYGPAEAAAQEAVAAAEARLEEGHPERVAAYLMRAYTYQFSRPPAVALEAGEQAYAMTLAVYPGAPRHPRAIEGRLVYGRALGLAGNLEAGVEQLARAVRDATIVFGPTSRMVGFFSLPLARFELDLGRVHESLEHSERALAIVATQSRPDSFRYAVALHTRGTALLAARRPGDALAPLAAAADTVARALSPSHLVTRAFRADHALALAAAGRPLEAARVLDPPAGPSPSGRTAGYSFYVLGVVARLSGRPAEALRSQQRALQALPAGRSADVDRLRVLTETGSAQLALGQPKSAADAFARSLAISRERQNPGPDRAEALTGLGRALIRLHRRGEAAALQREAAEIWRRLDLAHDHRRDARFAS